MLCSETLALVGAWVFFFAPNNPITPVHVLLWDSATPGQLRGFG